MYFALMYFARALPLIAVLATFAASGNAGAQGAGKGMSACRTDAATYCQNVEAGRGRRMACLNENKAKLSPECAQAIEGRGGRAAGAQPAPAGSPAPAAVGPSPQQGPAPPGTAQPRAKGAGGRMAACRTDLATFCATAAKGGGERMKCLKENQSKLSPDCQASLAQLGQQARTLQTACAADRQTLCAGVQKGGGAILQCLKSNRDKLSPACGEALSAVPERGGKGRRADAGATVPR